METKFKELAKVDINKCRSGIFYRVVCQDGFDVSIKCDRFRYCSPRETLNGFDLYESLEINTSEHVEELHSYQDGSNPYYAYVPIDTVEALLEKHGGIVSELENRVS